MQIIGGGGGGGGTAHRAPPIPVNESILPEEG